MALGAETRCALLRKGRILRGAFLYSDSTIQIPVVHRTSALSFRALLIEGDVEVFFYRGKFG